MTFQSDKEFGGYSYMFLKEHILNDHIKLDSQSIKPWLRCMLNFQTTDLSTVDTMKLRVKGVLF